MYQLPMDEMPDLTKLKADTHKNVPSEVAKLKGCPVLYEGTFTLDNVRYSTIMCLSALLCMRSSV